MGNNTREERLNRKYSYIENLYKITFKNFSQEFLDACQVNINFELTDDIKSLIRLDQDIHQLKKRVSKIYDTNKEMLDESRDLFYRLTLIHKAIIETMRTEFDIINCWENENGRLEYVQC